MDGMPHEEQVASREEIVLEAGHTERQYWKDLWRYRELFLILAWRDITARYKQTVVGILWAVLRPLLTMVVFTVVFGKLASLPSQGETPYALMVFAAMLPWQFFSASLTSCSESLVGNASLISKVYFPRITIPAASVIVNGVDLCISFSFLLLMMFFYSFLPPLQILCVLPLILLAGLLALGTGLLLCSLNVAYRDFRNIVPFITQFGLYISPVGFSSAIIPEKWQALYACNPMVGVIDGFRWAVLGNIPFPAFSLSLSMMICAALLWLGIRYFRSTEKTFADII